MDSKELLQQQLEELDKKSRAKLKPVNPAESVGISYNAELQRMVNQIKKDISESLMPQIKSLTSLYQQDSLSLEFDEEGNFIRHFKDGWFDIISASIAALKQKWSGEAFDIWAQSIASKFVRSADFRNQKQIKFGINALGQSDIEEYLKASVAQNVNLIKSIQQQYLDQVDTIVIENMRRGLMPGKIAEQLFNQYDITKRRAKFIARDQTAKINSDLTRKRFNASGVKYFRWVTSKDERVRSEHRKFANTVTKYGKGIYRLDKPPINSKGEEVWPGSDYGCRCVMIPVLQSEVDRNIKSGNVSNIER